jgi:hypothetical protein
VHPTPTGYRDTSKARAIHLERAAERAIDDPAQLARAARIVRVAIERGRLTPEDLVERGGDAA